LCFPGPYGFAAWVYQENAEDPTERIGLGKKENAGDKMMAQEKGKIGSSFEDYLKAEGSLEETTTLAVKRVLAWQIEQAMASQGVTKAKMAIRMKTSRSQLDRLLDPDNDKVQLATLHRAAIALGKRMMISIEDAPAT